MNANERPTDISREAKNHRVRIYSLLTGYLCEAALPIGSACVPRSHHHVYYPPPLTLSILFHRGKPPFFRIAPPSCLHIRHRRRCLKLLGLHGAVQPVLKAGDPHTPQGYLVLRFLSGLSEASRAGARSYKGSAKTENLKFRKTKSSCHTTPFCFDTGAHFCYNWNGTPRFASPQADENQRSLHP